VVVVDEDVVVLDEVELDEVLLGVVGLVVVDELLDGVLVVVVDVVVLLGGGGAVVVVVGVFCGHVQSAWHSPGQSALSAPSHCSLGWFTTPSPQLGAGPHAQVLAKTTTGGAADSRES